MQAKDNADSRPVVLVTGSTGFIGERVAAELGDAYRVVGLDLDEPAADWPGDKWFRCDLTSDESVSEALAKVRAGFGESIASVIHLAAYYDFSGEPSPLYDELTVEGTRRLVRALGDFEVEQFVFSSTLLAMKPVSPGEVIDEGSETQAEWAYPESKLDTEQVLEKSGLPVVVLRIAGVYADDCRSLPIGQHIKRIHEKQLESYLFPGNAEHGQPFVHIEDVTRLVRSVIERRGKLGSHETFLVAEPDLMTYEDLQDRLGELIHGKEWPTIRIPAPVAKAGAKAKELVGQDEFIKPWMVDLADAHYPVTIAKARELLDWEPGHRLEKTLPEMVERLKRDPEAFYRLNGLKDDDE